MITHQRSWAAQLSLCAASRPEILYDRATAMVRRPARSYSAATYGDLDICQVLIRIHEKAKQSVGYSPSEQTYESA